MKKGCKTCVYNKERSVNSKNCLKEHRAVYGYNCKDYLEKNVKGDENMVFENIKVKNKHGQELDFDVVTNYMDNDIREYLHGEIAPCSPQYFYDMYCKTHKQIHDEEFFTEGENITW